MSRESIASVLASFGVEGPNDFKRLPPGDRTHFIRMLYNGTAGSEVDRVSRALMNVGGAKFHYSADSGLPAGDSGRSFLKKLSFYSSSTVVTFPFSTFKSPKQLRKRRQWEADKMYFGDIVSLETSRRRNSIGQVSEAYWVERSAFDAFVGLCCRMSPFIDAGLVSVLALFPETARSLRPSSLGLLSANFNLDALRAQFEEDSLLAGSEEDRSFTGLTRVLLPCFVDIPLERVVEIRERESDLYNAFQRRLENLLYGSQALDSESKLLEYLRDVDAGVRELDIRFREIQFGYRRKNVAVALGVVAAGLAALVPIDGIELASKVLGSVSGYQFLNSMGEHKSELVKLSTSEFYVPWKVFRG